MILRYGGCTISQFLITFRPTFDGQNVDKIMLKIKIQLLHNKHYR